MEIKASRSGGNVTRFSAKDDETFDLHCIRWWITLTNSISKG
jgi:hypothetical protein